MRADGPIASTHVFRFRSLRRAGRSLFRERETMRGTEGLRFSRLVFVGSLLCEGFTFGPVDLRRQMAMCVWERESALDRFLEQSPIGRSWTRDCDEYCEVRMTAFRTHGTYRGQEPFAGVRREPPVAGPIALWTFANIPPRGLLHFWRSIRHAASRLQSFPGLVAGTAGPEHLYRGAMTFTIWDSLEDATAFSYREQPHKDIVRRVREHQLLTDSMFVRMRPYAAYGQWPSYSRFVPGFDAFAEELAGPQADTGMRYNHQIQPSGSAAGNRGLERRPVRQRVGTELPATRSPSGGSHVQEA